MQEFQFSITALADRVRTEGDAYALVEELRWNGQPVCPHCGAMDRISFLKPADGSSRKTRTGARSERRVWFCGHCRKQFTALVGTIFHGTKVSLKTWLFVVYEMCANKNGIAAREVQRKYNVSAKTAWFMCQRIREGMKRDPFASAMRGVVIADETFIGGDTGNRHKQGKGRQPVGAGSRSGPGYKKTAVLSLIDKSSGEVRSKIVPNVKGKTLRKAIAEQVDIAATTLHTDGLMSYRGLADELVAHEYVDHDANEYVRGDVTTNHVEGFFSQLKRSIDGTHHHVSVEHLPRYLTEYDFRYTTRKLSDDARTRRLFGQIAGRRLSYRPLTGM